MFRLPRISFSPAALALALLIAIDGSATRCLADKVDEDYRFAVELFNRKKWEPASEQFKSIIEEFPGSPRAATAKFYYGFTLMELERFEDARRRLREFVVGSPKSKHIPDAKYRIGECSFEIGDYETAERDLESFIADYPRHKLTDWAISYLGDSQLALKKYTEAQKSFQRIIDEFPTSELVEDGRWGLARVYERTDRFADALKLYREIATNGEIYRENAAFNVGMMHLELKKTDEAIAVFEQFPTNFPKSKLLSLAALNAGLYRYRTGDFQKSIENFQNVDSESRYRPQAIRYSALANVGLRRFDEAIRLLEDGAKSYRDDPAAETILFTLADTYRLSRKYPDAQRAFLKVRTDWPQGTYAPKAFHLAAECALLAGHPDQCANLLDEFDKTFTEVSNTLKTRSMILRGRMLLQVGGAPNQKKAVDVLNLATTSDSDSGTSQLAREYLVRALRSLGKHEQALNAARTLVDDFVSGKADDYSQVVLLAASSALQADKNDEAIRLSTEYLKVDVNSAEAYAIRARAEASKSNVVKANEDLEKLKSLNPELHLSTAFQLANRAYDSQDYATSGELFGTIVDSTDANRQSTLRPQSLSGLGWCRFKQKQYDAAVDAFGKLSAEFPKHELTPEGSLMKGQSLKLAGKTDAAIASLRLTFETYSTGEYTLPADAADAVAGSPQHHAFQSGIAAARLIGQNDVASADDVWSRIAARYPGSKKLDSVLEEWAFLNLEAENFKRSDEIFTRLVTSVPNSPRVPRANLALAESLLVNGQVDQAEQTFLELSKNKLAPEDIQEAALFQLIRIGQDKEEWIKVEARAEDLSQKFPESPYQNETRLRLGEARFNLEDLEAAVDVLEPLRKELLEQPPGENSVPFDSEWSGRLWVVLGEIKLIGKDYDGCRKLIEELETRDPSSAFLHQGYELVGRSFVRQSPANFETAREFFTKANSYKLGKGTRTAAKAQFMIGETWLFQKDYKQARRAYLRTSIVYPYPEWQAPALFQAAQCEESLQKIDNAIMTYEELIKNHPGTEFAKRAQLRLKSLQVETP